MTCDQGYSTRAHLAEVIGVLGPLPLNLLKRGQRSHEFFAEDGKTILEISKFYIYHRAKSCYYQGKRTADVKIPSNVGLESRENLLEGENKEGFTNLVKGMLQWRLEDRKTAKQLAQDL